MHRSVLVPGWWGMKARLLAVLLVSTLVLASAAPVTLAQAIAGNNQATSGKNNTERQYVNCSQVQNAFTGQYAVQDQYAAADGEANAEISQDLNISQTQVNDCLGGQPDGNNDTAANDTAANDTAANDTAANTLEDGKDDVLAGTDPGGTLPDTGGPSLLAVALGAALIVGGASLIRTGRGR